MVATPRNTSQTPVLIGAGQITQGKDAPAPRDPLGLMRQATELALEDAGLAAAAAPIDALWVVNTFCWSYRDAPGTLAETLGIRPRHTLYTAIGGNNPQRLVNRAARALARGEVRGVLITGAEAVYALRRMSRGEVLLDWPEAESPDTDRDTVEVEERAALSDLEGAYDLFLPAYMYPLFETALAAAAGLDAAVHQHHLGALCARLAAVAADNPRAWLHGSRAPLDAEAIARPAPGNRWIAYPYTKHMNANIHVDQGAAVLLTTAGEARRMGIPEARRVYPMGGGEANEVWHVSQRRQLHRSRGLAKAARLALSAAGLGTGDLTAFDLYSCFPCAVQVAQHALGLAASLDRQDPRPITLTGGLPYFGGPGNNYSLHAIAEAASRVRQHRDERVLVNAVGWYLTKHAVGIYGGEAGRIPWDDSAQAEEAARAQTAIDSEALAEPVPRAAEEGEPMRVVAFVIRHDREGAAERGTALGELESGRRIWADFAADQEGLAELEARGAAAVVGSTGTVHHDSQAGKNLLEMP